MDFLTVSLPFVKVLAAFTLMLLGIRFKIGLGISILIGSFALALLFGVGPQQWFLVGVQALEQEKFLLLAAIVMSILILSDAMERSGQSRRLMDSLSGYLVNPRLRLAFFPALIGLLPMPGGAVFSAPMLGSVAEKMPMKDCDRVLLNYWFRHIWELSWPLYPGMILAAALADIPILTLILHTGVCFFLMLALGWIFFLRPGVLPDAMVETEEFQPLGERRWRVAVFHGLPLIIAIVGGLGLEGVIASTMPTIPYELGVIGALLVGTLCVMVQNGLGLSFLVGVLTKKSLWGMILVVSAIFVFKDVMGAAHVVDAMAAVAGGEATLVTSAVVLPFLVGAIAGINAAFVGATFPLMLGVLDALGMQSQVVPYIALGSFCGFAGVMISPIHICFLLTCQYFKVEMAQAWRRVVLPSILVALFGIGWFFLLRG